MKRTFLTTTLPYANSVPHIGHMFEFVMADAITRFLKVDRNMNDGEIYFNTGLDCHGTKIKQKADELGISPQEYIASLEPLWKNFCNSFSINYDGFYLTSTKSHHKMVQEIWTILKRSGHIYKKPYKAKYCVGCEAFKQEKELIDGKCPDHSNLSVDEIEEENYFFKLGDQKSNLLEWIKQNPGFLQPEYKINELINMIEETGDISVSRLKSKCPWGVNVPDDEDHIIYVWFDALLNYVFAAGFETWASEDIHVIQICGPDNLRFQSIVFQGMLNSLNLKKSDKLLVHGTVVDVEGRKMSKTLGNVIDPMEQLMKYGLDAVRYYTLAGLSTYSDSSWDEKELKAKYNSDICNSWGNFVSRVLHLIDTKCGGEFNVSMSPDFFRHLADSEKTISELWRAFEIKEALAKTAELVSYGNKYINDNAPWNDKDPENVKRILSDCYHLIWVVAKLYSPVFPTRTEALDKALKERKKVILFERIP